MSDDRSSGFRKIAVLEHLIEAQVVGAILEEEGIPHRIRSFHDTAYDGLFQLQMGWGAVYAPETHEEAVREILNRVRSEGGASPP
jgi:hypothetical protein